MIKLLFSSVSFFIIFTVYGQTFTQLTNYQMFDNIGDRERVLQKDDQVYRIVQNNSNRIEVWQFLGDEMNKIYQSTIAMCRDEYNHWSNYGNYIIFFADDKFRLENIFAAEIFEEILFDVDSVDVVYPTNYSLNKGVLKIQNKNITDIAYDIDHKEFVPIFDDWLMFKTDEYYYYKKNINYEKYLIKRKYNSNEEKIVSSELNYDFYQIVNNKFYCQESNKDLIMVDQKDSIHRKYHFDNYIFQLFPIDDNEILAYGITYGNEPTNYFYTFDENSLEFKDTVSTDAVQGNMNFNFYHYFNHKILYSTVGFSCYESILKVFDINKKMVYDKFSGLSYLMSSKGDSIVFLKGEEISSSGIFAINMNDLSFKEVDFTPYNISAFDWTPLSIVYNDRSYIKVNLPGRGKTYVHYDYKTNKLDSTNAFIDITSGIGKSLKSKDNTVYINQYGKTVYDIKTIDTTLNDNLAIHELSGTLKSNIDLYKDNFYYFQLHDNQQRNFDLIKYNPKSVQEQVLISGLKTNFVTQFDFIIKDKFMLMRINDELPYSGGGYENWKIFDLEQEELVDSDEELVQMIYHLFFTTKEYYYTYTFNQNKKYYRINKDDLSVREEIEEVKNYSLLKIDDNTYSYCLNNDIFYCENNNCKKLNVNIGSVLYTEYFLSPDKKHFGLLIQNSTSESKLFVYDRTKNDFMLFDLSDYGVNGKTRISLTDNDFIYFKNTKSNNTPVFTYDFNEKNFRIFNSTNNDLDYLAINKDEIHLLDDDNILVLDKQLNTFETQKGERLELFNINQSSSLSDSIRVIFFKSNYNINDLDNTIITYNPSKRELNKFFDCEENLTIKDVVIKDDAIFCLIKNPDSGYQVYKMNVNRHYTSINNDINKQKSYIELYPNPVTNQLLLSSEIDKYRIISADGKLMIQSDTKADMINISELHQGVYFIEMEKSGILKIGKFIKI